MPELSREAYDALCLKLGRLLAAGGITVERAVQQGGTVTHWEPVAPETIVGCLLQRGWRVREVPADLEARVLTLAPREGVQ